MIFVAVKSESVAVILQSVTKLITVFFILKNKPTNTLYPGKTEFFYIVLTL